MDTLLCTASNCQIHSAEIDSRFNDCSELAVDNQLVYVAADGGGEVRAVAHAVGRHHEVTMIRVIAVDRTTIEVVVVELPRPVTDQLDTPHSTRRQ